jgi:hypothetical protein
MDALNKNISIKNTSSLILFTSVLLIICVVVGLVYNNNVSSYMGNNMGNNIDIGNGNIDESMIRNIVGNNIERFENMNYQDVKTKTLNWCDKMQKVGLLTPDQFNQCVATFRDATSGVLPKDFETPQTGMSRNYSLYNTQSKELTSDITGDNTNTIMLSNIDGMTLACKPDNSIYLVSNINDPKIEQKELYFTLVPQNEDVYAILSPYGKYLIASTEYGASFTGTSIGPMASWNIKKMKDLNNSNENSGNVMLESRQFSNFHLLYDNAENSLKIVYGNTDEMVWIMTSKLQTKSDEDLNNKFTGGEYYVAKENILQKIKTTEIQKICINAAIETFTKLSSMISVNFNNIANYVNNKLNDDQNTYRLSHLDYQTRLDSINQNSMLSNEAKANLISTISRPSGLDISDNDIMIAVSKINNASNTFLQNLEKNLVTPLRSELNKLNSINLNDEYNTYLLSLQQELSKLDDRINQNNMIMDRQKDTYNKINKTYNNQINKKKKIEDVDNIANANAKIINTYNQQNSYLNKLYPIGIFILAIIFIYLSYITFIKFRDNVWQHY